jgi:polysaccharide export outer membrane protein
MRYTFFPGLAACFLIALVLSFTSCISSKKVVYLNNLQDSTMASIQTAQVEFQSKIQVNDQLWVSVGGSNATDLIALNSGGGSGQGVTAAITSGGNTGMLGHLVEADGSIMIPYVGKVKVVGLTRLQLEDTLTRLYKDYTQNPVVTVKFLNYTFSVLGEVSRSGRFSMPTERTTILEAISMAGDITVLGKRENVLVIREVNGERQMGRLNLLSKDIFNSPYFYLKTNDIVYVEPVSTKFIARTGITQYLSIIAVGVSLILTIINVSK